MARKRRKVWGLSIGRRRPTRAQRIARTSLPVVGVAAAAAGSIALIRRGRNGTGKGLRDSVPRTMRRRTDPSAAARSARADVQQQLKAGQIELADVFGRADEEEAIGRTRVKVLLQNLPGVGPQGAMRAMDEMGIEPSRRIRGLGSNQRAALLQRFGGDAAQASA